MRKRWLAGLFLFICTAMAAHAGGGPSTTSESASRNALMKYYDKPGEHRKVEESDNGRTITICTDDCERFEIGPASNLSTLWDGILLFKAYLSKTMIDDAFSEAHRELARHTLQQRATERNCPKAGSEERTASCVLKGLTKASGFKMVRVVYDEGNKCESMWSFDQPQRLLGQRCKKATTS